MSQNSDVSPEIENEPPLSGGEMGMLGTGERSPTNRTFVIFPAVVGIIVVTTAIIWTVVATNAG
ncbi:hypothetical protein D9V32_09495 [Mycetocola tolaasinivorans]|uniref:Uncharacterized protein n=1 Tax=Mycetocola tolaasinivorans TaxID=76635 RepID=A0A3L7A8J6_9MICO|nr:hypothetical protein [Mycetocola tolaasinivorans]RLP75692.1 hypothetical protein D9V32_09495 [Mycetocola tolaasinivorans]